MTTKPPAPVEREDSDLSVLRSAIVLAIARARTRTDRAGLIAFLTDIRADIDDELIQALKGKAAKSAREPPVWFYLLGLTFTSGWAACSYDTIHASPLAASGCFVPVACTVDDAGQAREAIPPPRWDQIIAGPHDGGRR